MPHRKTVMIVGAALCAAALAAWACSGGGEAKHEKRGKTRAAHAMKHPKLKKEKPKMRPEVPASEISGDLFEPSVPASPADVKAYCDKWIGAAKAKRDEIVALKDARTVDNTLMAMNDLQIDIDHVLPFSELMANVHPDKKVRTSAEKCQ